MSDLEAQTSAEDSKTPAEPPPGDAKDPDPPATPKRPPGVVWASAEAAPPPLSPIVHHACADSSDEDEEDDPLAHRMAHEAMQTHAETGAFADWAAAGKGQTVRPRSALLERSTVEEVPQADEERGEGEAQASSTTRARATYKLVRRVQLREHLIHRPADLSAWIKYAHLSFRAEAWEEAIRAYDMVHRLGRTSWDVHYRVAHAHYQLFLHSGAIDPITMAYRYIMRALDTFEVQENPFVLHELGIIHMHLGSFEGAAQAFSRIIELHANYYHIRDVIFRAGVVLKYLKQTMEAKRLLEAVMDLPPPGVSPAHVMLLIAQTTESLGDHESAAAMYEGAFDCADADQHGYASWQEWYQGPHVWKALLDWAAARRLDPVVIVAADELLRRKVLMPCETLLQLAWAYKRVQDHASADDILEIALGYDPFNAELRATLGGWNAGWQARFANEERLSCWLQRTWRGLRVRIAIKRALERRFNELLAAYEAAPYDARARADLVRARPVPYKALFRYQQVAARTLARNFRIYMYNKRTLLYWDVLVKAQHRAVTRNFNKAGGRWDPAMRATMLKWEPTLARQFAREEAAAGQVQRIFRGHRGRMAAQAVLQQREDDVDKLSRIVKNQLLAINRVAQDHRALLAKYHIENMAQYKLLKATLSVQAAYRAYVSRMQDKGVDRLKEVREKEEAVKIDREANAAAHTLQWAFREHARYKRRRADWEAAAYVLQSALRDYRWRLVMARMRACRERVMARRIQRYYRPFMTAKHDEAFAALRAPPSPGLRASDAPRYARDEWLVDGSDAAWHRCMRTERVAAVGDDSFSFGEGDLRRLSRFVVQSGGRLRELLLVDVPQLRSLGELTRRLQAGAAATSSLAVLGLCRCGLGPNDIDALAGVLRGAVAPLEELHVEHNGIGDDAAARLAAVAADYFVARFGRLRTLVLRDEGVGPKTAGVLAELLPRRHHLTRLGLPDNDLASDAVGALADALARNDQLTELDLSGNRVESGAARRLAAALSTHPALLRLDLANNRIRLHGGRHLALGAETSPVLRSLRLDGNLALAEHVERVRAACARNVAKVEAARREAAEREHVARLTAYGSPSKGRRIPKWLAPVAPVPIFDSPVKVEVPKSLRVAADVRLRGGMQAVRAFDPRSRLRRASGSPRDSPGGSRRSPKVGVSG